MTGDLAVVLAFFGLVALLILNVVLADRAPSEPDIEEPEELDAAEHPPSRGRARRALVGDDWG